MRTGRDTSSRPEERNEGDDEHTDNEMSVLGVVQLELPCKRLTRLMNQRQQRS